MDELNLSPAALAALGKLLAEAAKKNRGSLEPGSYNVAEEVTLKLAATLKVGDDYDQRIVGKAKPWALLVAALDEANKRIRTLAKLAPAVDGVPVDPAEYELTLAGAVKMAETVNPDLAKAAQEKANKAIAEFKAPTLTPCKGKVTIKGDVSTSEPEAA
jgi:hypothetical protein